MGYTCQRTHRIISFIIFMLMVSFPVLTCAENPFIKEREDKGQLILEFVTPKKEVYRDIQIVFKDSHQFDNIVSDINKAFIFPEDIFIQFNAGDGPVYFPSKNKIQMSYDFIFYLTVLYAKRYPKSTDDQMINFALRSTTFLFYHEIAHAMIDVFDLPIVSNEEIAADNLAVILALEFTEDGYNIVMDSAELFDLLDMENGSKPQESDYWDEHALDAQRFYNILCLTYGKYPKRVMQELRSVGNKKLFEFIKEKGDDCIDEYQRQVYAWSKLLGPHFRE